MRRLWIAAAVLLALCAAAWANARFLDRVTGEITGRLTQAQSLAEDGDWDGAARLTAQGGQAFRSRAFYFHITLRHSDLDGVELSFREVEQLLAHRDRPGAYAAANARLVAQLELLAQSERFSLENIL